MTKESAEANARRYVSTIPDHILKKSGVTREEAITSSAKFNYEQFGVGTSPDYQIHGYERADGRSGRPI